jgi:gliding motility-associated-like protein
MQRTINTLLIVLALILANTHLQGQITSPNPQETGITEFGDRFYIFCAVNEGASTGSLRAETPFGASSTFTWEKYDPQSNTFSPYGNANPNDTLVSNINNLGDGCYRVTVESEGNTTSFKAWVLNNWIRVTHTEIPDSTSYCDQFRIIADYDYAPLTIYNTQTGQSGSVRNPNIDFKTQWYQGSELVRSYISPSIYPPIASDSPVKYNLTIEDEFGCTAKGSVDYISKVTKADFSASPMSGEAVLEVAFSNNSINYDSTIWFFYKDTYAISMEIKESKGQPVDSVDFVLFDDAPVWKYDMAGNYIVRLVTVKVNETGNCYDTLYMAPGTFIDVEETLLEIPNVFTPNGDGINDVFIVKSKSLRSMNIRIYNRWGGQVHSWKYSNIQSSDYTIEHSVWDGRVGNRMATPGVYYYVIQYEGRSIEKDEEERRFGKTVKGTKTGFIHLFRGKN